MESIRRTYSFITGPEHVVQFQRFCGVEPKKCDQKNETNGFLITKDHGTQLNGTVLRHKNGFKKLDLDSGLKTNGFAVNGDLKNRIDELISSNGVSVNQNNEVNTKISCLKNVDKKPYIVKNKFFYYLFCFGASLGNELFYLTFFPFLLWNVDSRLAREMVIVWHWAMYVGQATKDIVKWPRPASPPVFKLEDRYEQEYGMPSTHATVGAVIPFSILWIVLKYYEFPLVIGLVIAISWTTLVCCSRIYLGMHTVLDILAGLLFACIIMPAMLPFVGILDTVQTTHPLAIITTVLGSFLLCFVYPTQYTWSTTKGDTANVHAISSGVTLGTWLNYQLGLTSKSIISLPYQVQSPTFQWLFCSIACLIVGSVLLSGIRAVVKPSAQRIICFLYKIDRKNIDELRRHGAEVPLRFFTYHFVSIGATFLAPLVFNWLGIIRPEFYKEV